MMKTQFATLIAAIAMVSGIHTAHATVFTYNVKETFFEPDTQPNNTIFIGSFNFDDQTKTVSDLQGMLSESMTGGSNGYPNDSMTWLSLSHQLSAIYNPTLGGLLVTTFKNPTTSTFTTLAGGNGWSPQSGVDNGGIYAGWPNAGKNPGNAYATIFVNTTNPLAALTQAQRNKLAYADCAAGGMMGAVCMTGTTEAGYGAIGTMSGYPISQVITLASVATVPEAETYAMLIAGLGLMGFVARKRNTI